MAKGTGNVTQTRTVEVFRPGTFRAMSGQEYTFSEDEVRAIVDGYDATTAPAPVVVGHPSHDDPAFGWAQSFAINDDGIMVARLGDLAPEFSEAVNAGRYRKISMKFYAPDAANNPKPGTYYPRHIGFLGGAAPAVSGLKPVQFAEAGADELIEIEFAGRNFEEPAYTEIGGLLRNLREFFIERFSREDADKVLPVYSIKWIEDFAQPQRDAASFVAPNDTPANQTEEEPEMGNENAARAADLDARERALVQSEAIAFADGLVNDGKLLPVQRDNVAALLAQLSFGEPDDIAFADGDSKVSGRPADVLRAIFDAQPQIVPMGDVDVPDVAGASVAFAAPDGLQVDADGLELHAKALAYQSEHPDVDYIDAAIAVSEGA